MIESAKDTRPGVRIGTEKPPTKPLKLLKFQKALYPTRRYTMWRIQENVLEFKLRYGLERLFNTSIPKSIYNAFIEMIKCFIYLIKPHKTDNIF